MSADERDAMQAALAMLGRRALSAARVRERLAREFGAEEAERVVTRLLGLGVLDDRRYAEAFTRDRALRAGHGRARIRADLLARGVSAADVDAAIAAVVDPAAERERAAGALERFRRVRATRARRADERKLREAAFRHLLGRGFSVDLVRELLA
jgi:regulatory protein